MFVKPALSARTGALLKVRHPRTKALLPETGADVPETFFWLRRLRDGDVVPADPATGEVLPASQSPVPAAAPAVGAASAPSAAAGQTPVSTPAPTPVQASMTSQEP